MIPNGAYNGQKLIKLVKTKIPAKANNTIPNVPGITFVKYKTAIIAAIITRITLSAPPIFFFMTICFLFQQTYNVRYLKTVTKVTTTKILWNLCVVLFFLRSLNALKFGKQPHVQCLIQMLFGGEKF